MKTAVRKTEQQEAIDHLRKILKPGDTVYAILNNVSRSGMSRRISLAIGDGKLITNITWHAARALGEPIKNRAGYVQDSGIAISGCGMDMGFELVYQLGRVMFPDGFAVIETKYCTKCEDRPVFGGLGRTCKHCKGAGTITTPVRGRNGDMSGWDNDGGYALNHKWL